MAEQDKQYGLVIPLTEDVFVRLDRMRRMIEAKTMTAVFDEALANYEQLLLASQEGKPIYGKLDDGTFVELHLL